MLTFKQAYRRSRRYIWLSRLILAACMLLFIGGALKNLVFLTQGYLEWLRPFSILGWWIQVGARNFVNTSVGAFLWAMIPALNLPQWLFSPEAATLFSGIFVSGILQRAGIFLQSSLAEAMHEAQKERWKGELRGDPPSQKVSSVQIGTQINYYSAQPTPSMPWWTKPLGLVTLTIFAGVLSGVATQWLNITIWPPK